MNAVERGLRVVFLNAKTEAGDPAGTGRGMVLDQAFEREHWYVMPEGADRAVVVHRKDLDLAATR